ncbi:hypothetical protein ACB092_06G065600 [Castanea dentata]
MADIRRSRKTPLSLHHRRYRLLQDLSAPPSTLLRKRKKPAEVKIDGRRRPCKVSTRGNYLINYLATRGPDWEHFVVGSLIQLLCRITKFGWLDDDRFKEVMKFLSQILFWPILLRQSSLLLI